MIHYKRTDTLLARCNKFLRPLMLLGCLPCSWNGLIGHGNSFRKHMVRAPNLIYNKKMYEFESAAQRQDESIREWTIRLERQVTELNIMAKEAAKLNIAGYSDMLRALIYSAVYESSHKFRLLDVRVEDQTQEAFMAALRVQLHELSVAEAESSLISYEQGRKVQRALAGAGSTKHMFPMDTRPKMICFACEGTGHAWQCCREPSQRGEQHDLLQRA
jgi:hypothetical protein